MLDKPTTGLSEPDIEQLLQLLKQLVQQGGTVIVTEHNPMTRSRPGSAASDRFPS